MAFPMSIYIYALPRTPYIHHNVVSGSVGHTYMPIHDSVCVLTASSPFHVYTHTCKHTHIHTHSTHTYTQLEDLVKQI